METIYEMSYGEQGIDRSQFGIFGFPSHKRVTWTPKYNFNVTGCSDWLKESGRNDWTNIVYYRYNSTLFIIDITYIRWARKPVNHTNRMDVVCCHLIDRPQSVSQLSYNRTLQFSKTFRLNRNTIFSRSSNVILPLENPLNVLCKQF